jgi:hypothetical protein
VRRALVALLLVSLAGCDYDDDPPATRSVVLYWDFLRHTQTAAGNLVYDANVNVGGGDAACVESGVEVVQITDPTGQIVNPEFPDVPCVFQGVQGVQIDFVPLGRQVWTLTGYRGSVPTFATTVTLDIVGNLANVFDTRLEGIQDDLDLSARFLDATGTAEFPSCAAAGVQTLDFVLVDGIGTVVAAGQVPCGTPPVVPFRVASGTAVDRDTYSVRMKGFRPPDPLQTFDSETTALAPQCIPVTFDHHGPQAGPSGVGVVLYDITASGQIPCI